MLSMQMRRNISLVLFIALLVVTGVVWSMGSGEAGLKDGVYFGSAQGFGGTLTVEVTVAGGAIAKVAVLENSETPFIAEQALREVPEAIVAQQSWEVEAVSGATVTSKAIMAAVEAVLFTD